MKAFSYSLEPKPISLAEQKELDLIEENENKKREHEARQAQKRLEEEKARLRIEQQQQIIKQEENAGLLKVFFPAMNLAFHKVSLQTLNMLIVRRRFQHQHVLPFDLSFGAARELPILLKQL